MKRWIILVNNSDYYEYETEIEANTCFDARKIWKKRGDHKTVDFRVSEVK